QSMSNTLTLPRCTTGHCSWLQRACSTVEIAGHRPIQWSRCSPRGLGLYQRLGPDSRRNHAAEDPVMELKGIAAIVTSGASGLGAATATLLAAHGARVTLFDLNEQLGKAHAGRINGQFVAVNVTDDQSVASGLAAAAAAH